VFGSSLSESSSSESADLLAVVPVFATLARSDLERIAQVAVPRGFAPGEVVFREGDASDTCYVVRDGRCRAVREHADGRTITLAMFGHGDIFGELAMFEEERRSATIEAVEELHVVGVLGADMRRLMREHPEISMRLVVALGRRLRETNERLARQSFQTVQSRVATVLLQLVQQAEGEARRREVAEVSAERGSGRAQEPAGAPAGEAALADSIDGSHEGARGDVLITATQADVAQLAGSSRESASRFLAVLERAGVISQGRGRLIVHKPDALGAYVF
jgi:CRP/FNR family transcriptional regulator, cyclic AMP receptor protein